MRISDWSSDVCSSDLIGKQIRPTQLGLLVDDRFDQLQIGVEKRRLARQIALDQRFTNEDRSRLGRIRRTIVARTCQQRQAEQTDEIGRASCRERVGQYV